MSNNKTPIPRHVLRTMRRDDGYIITEAAERGKLQYVVYIRTVEGHKSLCTISFVEFKQLHDEGYIYHAGDGKWKLREKLPIADDKHKL